MHVVTGLVEGEKPSAKSAAAALALVSDLRNLLVVVGRDDVLNCVSLRNEPRVHLIEAGQLNTYDVLVSDEVVFTEAALAEFVAGPATGKRRGVEKPDLTTPDVPGAIPSIQPVQGTTDLDVAAESTEETK